MRKPVTTLERQLTKQAMEEMPMIVEDTIKAIHRAGKDNDGCRVLAGDVVHILKNGYGFKRRYRFESEFRIRKVVGALAYWGFLQGWSLKRRVGFVHESDSTNSNRFGADAPESIQGVLEEFLEKERAKIRQEVLAELKAVLAA